MKWLRQPLVLVAIAVIVLSVGYSAYGFLSAESRVRALCQQIAPGMPLSQLSRFAYSNGMGPEPHDNATNFIVERRSFGRYGCKVVTEAGAVKSVDYTFAD